MEPIFAIMLFAGGILEGLYASTVGCGAILGISLLLLTGLPIHVAIGTNRFSVPFLESASAIHYQTKKRLLVRDSLILGIIAAAGSIIGSMLVMHVNDQLLDIMTAVILVSVLIAVMFNHKLGIHTKPTPGIKWTYIIPAMFLLGIYGGFLGAGFGSVATFIFLISGYSFLASAANSRVVGLIMSIPAIIIFAMNGTINYGYGLSLGLGTAIGGWIGSGIGMKKGNLYIKILFLIVTFASILKLFLGF
jgi:uncharacterized membrane protein YfcA